MSSIDDLIDAPQFSLSPETKDAVFLPLLRDLVDWHSERCPIYGDLIAAGGLPNPATSGVASLAYLPVRAFKQLDLMSIDRGDVVKVLTSSGTTGQNVSRIYLDAENATRQQRALSSVMTTVLGPDRLPMLIVDTRSIIASRTSFSARAAGVIGMMTFGRDHTWLLNDNMSLRVDVLEDFLAKHDGRRILIFGFTFMVWQYLLRAIPEGKYDLSKAALIHSGGWKKLESVAVDNEAFKAGWARQTGLTSSYNFYGMVEQIGSIFVEGEDGWLHCPNFADVVIRNPEDWSVALPGEPGVIEVVSALPTSYPGHVLLTEDLGVAEPDPGPGGWRGPRFKVLGRLPKAELRGCSDTHTVRALANV